MKYNKFTGYIIMVMVTNFFGDENISFLKTSTHLCDQVRHILKRPLHSDHQESGDIDVPIKRATLDFCLSTSEVSGDDKETNGKQESLQTAESLASL
jgi:hypothetical protein